MAGTCGSMLGGRRRKSKKGGKTGARRRTMRGGMGYGMNGTIGTAGALYSPAWGGEITKSGEPIYDTADRPAVTGGRRRKSKKGSKKGRRRTMRGGAQWQSVAPAGGAFTGEGARGLLSLTGYDSKVPVEGGPAQNFDGAYRA
jgi:hypothetical protein